MNETCYHQRHILGDSMITFVLLYMALPWLAALILVYKDYRLILVISPITSVIAFIINGWGTHFHFWRVAPYSMDQYISAMPYNLGIFPVLCSYMIYFISVSKIDDLLLIFVFTLGTTGLEYLSLYRNHIVYDHGWTIYWTFISYLIPYFLVYGYYRLLTRKDDINSFRKLRH